MSDQNNIPEDLYVPSFEEMVHGAGKKMVLLHNNKRTSQKIFTILECVPEKDPNEVFLRYSCDQTGETFGNTIHKMSSQWKYRWAFFKEVKTFPKNNDGRALCYSCGSPTKIWKGINLSITHHVCSKCGK